MMIEITVVRKFMMVRTLIESHAGKYFINAADVSSGVTVIRYEYIQATNTYRFKNSAATAIGIKIFFINFYSLELRFFFGYQ